MSREVTILTPEQVELKFELAGIGSRFIARLLDGLLLAAIGLTLALIFVALGISGAIVTNSARTPFWVFAVYILVSFVVGGGYFLFFEACKNGQTPGKGSVGIRVIRDTGHPVDFRSALIRNVMRAVDELFGAFPVGLVSIFFSSDYRRFGDYVGGTLVVKAGRKSEMPSSDESGQVAAAARIPNTSDQTPSCLLPQECMPLLSKVTREDYRAVRHFLDRRAELDADVAQSLSYAVAAPIAEKLQTDPAVVGGNMKFLEEVRAEWERRMIH